MIQNILAKLGYVKIPVTVVQLSMFQEKFLENLVSMNEGTEGSELVAEHLASQKAITSFLRTGRSIC